jgi:hypothetical protein
MNYEQLQQGIQDNLPIPSRDELWEAIENNDLEKYTPEQIEQGMLQEKDGRNLYHEASKYGHLNQIPKELLTKENLLQPVPEGDNSLHWPAITNQLKTLPNLPYKTLLKLKAHFETKDCPQWKEEILATLKEKINTLELIANSLKKITKTSYDTIPLL